MIRLQSVLAAFAVCFAVTGNALALVGIDYTFSVYPTSGGVPDDVAYGTLQTDGAGDILSGTMTVLSSSDGNGAVGTWEITSSGFPGYGIDNVLYPGNSAQYLDGSGLGFAPVSVPGGDLFLNIWGNGGSDYAFYGATPTNTYGLADGSGLTFTLTPVGVFEPSALAVWGLGLAAVFLVSRRRLLVHRETDQPALPAGGRT